mgnify:CR=1 FL=1
MLFRSVTNTGIYKSNRNIAIAVEGIISAYAGPSSTFGVNGGLFFGGAQDLWQYRDGANALAQRNSTNAQAYNLYNTYTDASNYERLAIAWSGNALLINVQALGTGTQRNIGMQINSGLVGIGTSTPSQKLSVVGGNLALDNNRSLYFKDSAGTEEGVLSVSIANNLSLASPTLSGSIQYAVRYASGIHQFLIGGSEKMRIDSSGNVGIGTNSPTSLGGTSGILTLYGSNATAQIGRAHV